MITPLQCRMARHGLGLSLEELARRAGLGINTISRFETDAIAVREASVARIERALRDAGASFPARSRHGAGVRVRPGDGARGKARL